MKYSELISFYPLEEIIQLTSADDKNTAREYVKTYVMSDKMAENLRPPMIEQLQMDEVVDNKGILVVGNYGTGKSHLMSVISSIATDKENLEYLQNKDFAKNMERIAGKFEVLRIEIGGITMSLREIIFGYIQEDFEERGIKFTKPDFSTVRDNKKLVKDMMIVFSGKYPDKGYLIVVDEFLSYLSSRDEREIVLDLDFLRVLGEMCSKSKLRVIFGVQEKIFDNPRFSFVSETLKKVADRFTQVIITKQDTAYVVSERVLKKTPEQKALIRKHLEKFSKLYTGMASKLDEFIDLFPIHPSYIDVFNKIYLIENRHVLKNISLAIKDIFDTEVPENEPGVISFDDYWSAIKSNNVFRSDVTISRVVNASEQLEEIVNRSFPKPVYKPLAVKIIYALSVHRLTTSSLDVQFGLTAENLKDDLCLFLPIPQEEADFLLGVVKTTLKDIMTTVSGQFIIYNEANNQYYIDVDKTVDYDEKIKQKAIVLSPSELNRNFYTVVYSCLEWDAKQYVTNFNIYEYDLNWESHNVFREGYLFMGLPGERSTAQPERDFYIHIMPPYNDKQATVQNLEDEIYFYFKSTDEFREILSLYAAANSLALISEGKDKDAYFSKAEIHRRRLIKYLTENVNTCFNVLYKKQKNQIIEILKGQYNRDYSFKDSIDLVASICFDEYFGEKYPDYPVMKTKITRRNMADNARAAFDHFAGRKTQQSTAMLQSFNLLENDRIRPEKSKYASYYIGLINNLPPQGVLNYTDLFEPRFTYMYIDKKFKIEFTFTPIIFLSLVYAGYAIITLTNGTTVTASNLDQIPRINASDLYEFKYISRPPQIAMAELKRLFDILDINPALLDNPNDREKGVAEMLQKVKDLSNSAAIAENRLNSDFELWGESLVNATQLASLKKASTAVRDEFSNYTAKYNTPAKLNNFNLSLNEIETLGKQIALVKVIQEYMVFKTDCAANVTYISNIEFMDLGAEFKSEIEQAKAEFRNIRDSIMNGVAGDISAQKINKVLTEIKQKYINIYFGSHKKKRLGINDAKRRGKIQESLTLSNLRKLQAIEILSSAKLSAIEQDLSELKICYELTPDELKNSTICPHCRYSLDEKAKNVFGQLDTIEIRIDDLLSKWTQTLLNTLDDPIVLSQKEFLNNEQQRVVDSFVSSKTLPEHVDEFFVQSIRALLKGFEPLIIETEDLMQKLDKLGPCDVNTFKTKLADIVADYIRGKDISKLRIIVKHKERGV